MHKKDQNHILKQKVYFQRFTDDINTAMDLVLQDNGRTPDEKRKDINKIRYELNALRSSVRLKNIQI